MARATNRRIEELVQHAEVAGVPDDALDELVHDLAQEAGLDTLNAIEDPDAQEVHIFARELEASTINNSGLEGQIRWLLRHGVTLEDIELRLFFPVS